MNSDQLLALISAMSKKIHEEKDYLTDLDNVIGDGDHGINMARGFAAVEGKLPELKEKDCGFILKTMGMTMVSVIGGSSGPLYGTAFMKAGMSVNGKDKITEEDFVKCFDAAIDGVMMRGKAVKGEKTMLDSMIPARDAIKKSLSEGSSFKSALSAGVDAAREGVEYTKTIIATKGRAAYLGDRSLGHQDPGATSFAVLLEVIAEMV